MKLFPYVPRVNAADLPIVAKILDAREEWKSSKGSARKLALAVLYDRQYEAIQQGFEARQVIKLMYGALRHEQGPMWCCCLTCKPGLKL